jgi:hypothetical protein
MKASEFINLMRKAIREEVRVVIKEELKAIKPLLEQSRVTKPSTVTKLSTAPKVLVKPTPKPQRTTPLVTMDQGLASLLNEGDGFGDTEEWPDMNGGPMTSDQYGMGSDFGEFGMNGFAQQPQHAHQPSTPMRDPLMRDYSGIMKAAEQHAQGFRP